MFQIMLHFKMLLLLQNKYRDHVTQACEIATCTEDLTLVGTYKNDNIWGQRSFRGTFRNCKSCQNICFVQDNTALQLEQMT